MAMTEKKRQTNYDHSSGVQRLIRAFCRPKAFMLTLTLVMSVLHHQQTDQSSQGSLGILRRFGAYAQPCPKETPLFGGARLDGSGDEYMQYFAVADDDLTRITQFRYCKCCINSNGDYEHFRGFEVGITSPVSGYQFQTFGTVNGTANDETCITYDLSQEELMFSTIFADSNDMEGLIFEGNGGTTWTMRANGKTNQRFQLEGRPIGFRVWMGQGGRANQPLLVAIVYNNCNCPASTYTGDNPFNDMTIEAVVGATQIQTLQYRTNYMNSVYGQDCGSYGIRYFPEYSFFSFSQSGAVDAEGRPYTDTGTFTAGTIDDIGQYIVTVETYQDQANPDHGYFQPFRGTIPTSQQTVTLTILPCVVTSLTNSVSMGDLTYSIGNPDKTQGTYAFVDQPNSCGYQQITSVTGVPVFVIHDEVSRDFTVFETFDHSLVGVYPVTIDSYIDVPDTYEKLTFTRYSVQQTFNIKIEPCILTGITNTVPIPDHTYVLGDPRLTTSSYEFEQVPDCQYIINYSESPGFAHVEYREPRRDFRVSKTIDLSLIGSYDITVNAEVTHFTDSSKSDTVTVLTPMTFTLFIEPCVVTDYVDTTTIIEIYYPLGTPDLTDGYYVFDEVPGFCGYPETVTLTNLPAFAQHQEPTSDFFIPSTGDLNLMGEYTVTIRSEISVPIDYTQTSFTPFFVEYDFLIIVEPCVVSSYDVTTYAADITYFLGTPDMNNVSPYLFTQNPDCGYAETVTLTNLPAYVTHDGTVKDFSVPENYDLSLIGQQTVVIRGEIQVPLDATQTSFLTMFKQYTFLVTIEPCDVIDYVDTTRVIELRYNIGAPDLTDGTYIFDEVPFCGYPETVKLTDLPTFTNHNLGASDFTIPQNSDLGILGEYLVNIESRISVPDDYTKGSYTDFVVAYNFNIFIEPCLVTSYDSTIVAGPIEYFVGDPDETDGAYAFADTPACNYPQHLTLTDLPVWTVHNEATQDFTIPQFFDLSLIGEYVVTVHSQISVPDDYTNTTFTVMEVEYPMSILIQPCIIIDFTTVPINTITYTIGDSQELSQQYNFVQNPTCGYPETVTVTGLPSFAIHQEPQRKFLVPETQNLALHGLYDVTIRSEIYQPTDYTKTDELTIFQEYTFQIDMIDPCFDSSMLTLFISDMTRAVKEAELTQQLFDIEDTVSQNYGLKDGLTYCGPRIIEMTTDSTVYTGFMTFDPVTNVIGVQTDDPNQVNTYTIDAKVSLVNYPGVFTTTTFIVDIINCIVIDMQQTPLAEQFYNVYTPMISFGTQFFTMTPLCGYTLEYRIQIKDSTTGIYSPLPAWLENTADLDFEVQTDDPLDVGIYDISIIGTTPIAFQDPVYEEELIIRLNVKNQCKIDEVTPLQTISDQLYYIAESGTYEFFPTWSTAVPGCPVTYEIGRMEGGVERALTADEYNVITHSTVDGSMSFTTSDYTLDGEIWTIRLYKKSTYSEGPKAEGAYLFDIEFRDICWDSSLQAGEFQNDDYVFDVWQFQQILFDEMVDLSLGTGYCGGYTTELEYVSGPVLDTSFPLGADLSLYNQIAQSPTVKALEGSVNTFDWLGSHILRLKSTLGSEDTSPTARGDNGLYMTVYSDPVELIIINPCLNSTVNMDGALVIDELIVPEGQTSLEIVNAGPTDSMSALYGNGYNRCGNLRYDYFAPNGVKFILDVWSNQETIVQDFADEFKMRVSSPPTGTTMTANATLIIQLEEYPTAKSAAFAVNITYRECFPLDFSGPEIEQQNVQVGDDQFSLDVKFDQYPCQYEQIYTYQIIDKETGDVIDVPGFISPEGEVIIINPPDGSEIGEYEIQVCSQIINSLQTKECTSFDVIVEPVPSGETTTKEPDFMINLADQRVKVGNSLAYTPGDSVNLYGAQMNVEVDLGPAILFASYDKEMNMFKVHSNLLTKDFVGEYPIHVKATFFNETMSETYQKFFILTVWDDIEPDEESWFPPDPIYYPEWEPTDYIRKNMTQPDDPDRPIPYILDLSQDGVLIIGWDKTMEPPEDFDRIPPTKIAVEPSIDLDEIRFWQDGIRSLQADFLGDVVLDPSDPELVYFANATSKYYERMQLIDALELLITPDDPETSERVEFTWDILAYSEDYIWLQLDFKNPWAISNDQAFDTLSVTFWGVEFFKSIQDKEVLYGTTLYWPIMRQVSRSEKQSIDSIHSALGLVALATLLFILPIITAGSLLPTWMFINSLSIIAHMVLLKSLMPANAHFFLEHYLNWLRWYDKDFEGYLQETFDYKSYRLDFGAYHVLLQACGYDHLFASNMVIIIIILLALLIIWGSIATVELIMKLCDRPKTKDFEGGNLEKPRKRMKSTIQCQNFILRFCYEFFLIFCVCLFLQLSVTDFDDFSPSLQYVLSVILVLGIAGLLIFVVRLFFCRGPWVPGYYTKKTALGSINWYRPRDESFDHKKYIEEHPKPPIKPWGRCIITFDMNKLCCCLCQKGNKNQIKFFRADTLDKKATYFDKEEGAATDRHLLNDNDQLTLDDKEVDIASIPLEVTSLDGVPDGRSSGTRNSGATNSNNVGIDNNTERYSQPNEIIVDVRSENRANEKYLIATAATSERLQDSRQTSSQSFALRSTDQMALTPNGLVFAEQLEGGEVVSQVEEANVSKPQVEIMPHAEMAGESQPEIAQEMSQAEAMEQLSQAQMSNEQFSQYQLSQAQVSHAQVSSQKQTSIKDLTDEPKEGSSDEELAENVLKSYKSRLHHYYQRRIYWRDKELERGKLERRMHREARRRLKLEDATQPYSGYKTLFYGLKKGHERNVAIVHPLMYFLRRIIYALVIVFMDEIPIWGVVITMVCCLIMLAYALHEKQWVDQIINSQHMINETFIYVLCVLLLLFSSYTGSKVRVLLGYFLIVLVLIFVIFNTIVIIYYSLQIFYVFLKRIFVQCRRKRMRNEALDIVKKINDAEKEWFVPREIQRKRRWFRPKDSGYGGYKVEQVIVEEAPLEVISEVSSQDEQVSIRQSNSDSKHLFVRTNNLLQKKKEQLIKKNRQENEDIEQLNDKLKQKDWFNPNKIGDRRLSRCVEEEGYGEDTSSLTESEFSKSAQIEEEKIRLDLGLIGKKDDGDQSEYSLRDSNGNSISIRDSTTGELKTVQGLIPENNPVDITNLEEADSEKRERYGIITSDVVSEANKMAVTKILNGLNQRSTIASPALSQARVKVKSKPSKDLEEAKQLANDVEREFKTNNQVSVESYGKIILQNKLNRQQAFNQMQQRRIKQTAHHLDDLQEESSSLMMSSQEDVRDTFEGAGEQTLDANPYRKIQITDSRWQEGNPRVSSEVYDRSKTFIERRSDDPHSINAPITSMQRVYDQGRTSMARAQTIRPQESSRASSLTTDKRDQSDERSPYGTDLRQGVELRDRSRHRSIDNDKTHQEIRLTSVAQDSASPGPAYGRAPQVNYGQSQVQTQLFSMKRRSEEGDYMQNLPSQIVEPLVGNNRVSHQRAMTINSKASAKDNSNDHEDKLGELAAQVKNRGQGVNIGFPEWQGTDPSKQQPQLQQKQSSEAILDMLSPISDGNINDSKFNWQMTGPDSQAARVAFNLNVSQIDEVNSSGHTNQDANKKGMLTDQPAMSFMNRLRTRKLMSSQPNLESENVYSKTSLISGEQKQVLQRGSSNDSREAYTPTVAQKRSPGDMTEVRNSIALQGPQGHMRSQTMNVEYAEWQKRSNEKLNKHRGSIGKMIHGDVENDRILEHRATLEEKPRKSLLPQMQDGAIDIALVGNQTARESLRDGGDSIRLTQTLNGKRDSQIMRLKTERMTLARQSSLDDQLDLIENCTKQIGQVFNINVDPKNITAENSLVTPKSNHTTFARQQTLEPAKSSFNRSRQALVEGSADNSQYFNLASMRDQNASSGNTRINVRRQRDQTESTENTPRLNNIGLNFHQADISTSMLPSSLNTSIVPVPDRARSHRNLLAQRDITPGNSRMVNITPHTQTSAQARVFTLANNHNSGVIIGRGSSDQRKRDEYYGGMNGTNQSYYTDDRSKSEHRDDVNAMSSDQYPHYLFNIDQRKPATVVQKSNIGGLSLPSSITLQRNNYNEHDELSVEPLSVRSGLQALSQAAARQKKFAGPRPQPAMDYSQSREQRQALKWASRTER